jgi:hypothetical protein
MESVTMKKFRVLASYRTYVYAIVEAENEDQAYDIAHDMDGGDFERARLVRLVNR